MMYFITKYALTEGIRTVDATLIEHCDNESMIGQVQAGGHSGSLRQYFHGEGKEWHRTRSDAVKRAEEMRAAKIKSLEKSLAKLQKLKFS